MFSCFGFLVARFRGAEESIHEAKQPFRNLNPETFNRKPETGNRKPETGNWEPLPVTRHPSPVTRHPYPNATAAPSQITIPTQWLLKNERKQMTGSRSRMRQSWIWNRPKVMATAVNQAGWGR